MTYKLWAGNKLSVKYLHVQGCLVKVRPYSPNKKKLDSRMISYDFIRYFERSRYKFYELTTKPIFKLKNTQFFDDVEFKGGNTTKDFIFKVKYVDIPTGIIGFDQDFILDFI